MGITNRLLFDFESLVDVYSGCIRYILNKDSNIDLSYFDISNSMTLNWLKNTYVGTIETNPLRLILKFQYKDSADNILDELLKSCYKDILDNSIATDVLRLIKTYNFTTEKDVIQSTINCTNEYQENLIKSVMQEERIGNNIYDMENYDAIFVSTVDKLDKYTHLLGKNVYIHNIRRNYDDKFRLEETMKKYINIVIIHTIDPYIGVGLYRKGQ